jgi:hypothetical protein
MLCSLRMSLDSTSAGEILHFAEIGAKAIFYVVAAYVGYKGLETWRNKMMGKEEYIALREMLEALIGLRAAYKSVRTRKILSEDLRFADMGEQLYPKEVSHRLREDRISRFFERREILHQKYLRVHALIDDVKLSSLMAEIEECLEDLYDAHVSLERFGALPHEDEFEKAMDTKLRGECDSQDAIGKNTIDKIDLLMALLRTNLQSLTPSASTKI